jgi:hypothetical protein
MLLVMLSNGNLLQITYYIKKEWQLKIVYYDIIIFGGIFN